MEFNVWDFIAENVLYLVPALVFIGWCIKQIPHIPNWLIPFALVVLGIIGAGFILGWTVDSVVQGVLVAAGAVLSNQMLKQFQDARNGES